MAKKKKDGINRSAAIRDLLKEMPDIKANDAVKALGEKGIKIKTSLFYIVKGKVAGGKSRRRRNRRKAVEMMTAPANGGPGRGTSDALTTIRKIKLFAAEVGGLRTLKSLVDILSEYSITRSHCPSPRLPCVLSSHAPVSLPRCAA
jgi:hypothetical protein